MFPSSSRDGGVGGCSSSSSSSSPRVPFSLPPNWTVQENKVFENALEVYPDDTPAKWQFIASLLPGKTPQDVFEHYKRLVEDLALEEEGLAVYPYDDDDSDDEDNKGVPWTKEEHILFLQGLKRYGKGNWKEIARHVVISKTPKQVANHATSFFKRQASRNKSRRSINDITEP